MKKLMIFLMVAIPLVIIILVNFTVDVVIGNVSISVDRIELDRENIVANIDEQISLEATIFPSNATNQEIIWKSTNENVAKVDLDGNVTFVGFGNGYITATTADGNKMDSCYFYVTDTVVHQVVLTAPYTDVHVGTTVQLTATVLPNEAENKLIHYQSSDPEIAKVDQNGLVKGLKVGYVTITAISDDGNYTDFVNLAIINPVEDIILNTDYAITGESTYSIGYQIYPNNATNTSVEFSVDDPTVASVNSLGKVSFLKAGEVNVKLTTVDGGYSKTMKIIYTAGYAQSLTLSKYTITATIGDTAQLIEYSTVPSYLSSTEVTFTSSNENIVFISNGYIYFVGGGSAIVTVSVEKSKNEYITEQLIVYVESPATGILIDDIVTAEKTVNLNPTSFPEDSTNDKYFYHSNSSDVSVNSNGVVTFLTDNPMTATITIFANTDYSDISKSIKVEYTAGKAKEFSLSTNTVTFNYGEAISLDYILFPSNANTQSIQLSIISQENNSGEGQVVEILPDGSIRGIGGGKALIEASLVLFDGQKKTETVEATVLREVENIDIFIDLEKEEDVYVTATNTVSFSANVYPSDATNKNLIWSVDNNSMAIILGNTFKFNQTGTVTLIATTSSGLQEEVQIRYTGTYPISAEVGILTDSGVKDLPLTMSAGDSYKIVVKSIFPANTINQNISLKVSNQSTSSPLGQVLNVNGNTLSAIAGGKATLTVYVSATVVLVYEIQVYQKVESIEISPSNIQTTNSSILLEAIIDPIDATNKNVNFEILTPDLAYIENNVLYFKGDGIVEIIAVSEDNPEIKYSFYIEKIAKGTGSVDPSLDSINMFVGDSNKLDFSGQGIYYSELEIVFAEGADEEVIEINNDIISAIGSGETEIICYLYDEFGSPIKTYKIKIIISQLVQDIIYSGKLETYNEYITTAKEEIDLNFSALPSNAMNNNFDYEIVSSYDSDGIWDLNLAYIENGKLHWIKSGTLTLSVHSADGNCSKKFNFRYTGGDALDAQINLDEEISLNVGESVTINVEKWMPSDTINKNILIRELNHTVGVNVISIDSKNLIITASNGGYSQIVVELSNGITKNIRINVIKKVSAIVVSEENIVSASNEITINASVLPSSATNKTLSYSMINVDFAYLQGNKVMFTSAGTVVVTISTMDGSNLTKQVSVTCTMGYINSIHLNTYEKTISKGGSFSLYVIQVQPSDATNKEISCRILSQIASDESGKDVINLKQSGNSWLIEGKYGGQAIIRIYSINSLGEEIYSDCIINVQTPVEKIEIEFVDNLDYYQNYYVTSKNELEFREHIIPEDSTNKQLNYYVSDSSKAEIKDHSIIFKEAGLVTVTFESKDNSNKTEPVSFTIYYVDDSIIDASLDLSGFENNILYLQAGQSKELVLKKIIPSDNDNIEISMKNLVENRIDMQKEVLKLENGVLTAVSGGEATFDLYVNNFYLGSFTVKVERLAESISLEQKEVFISNTEYQIIATVLPSDSNEKALSFISSDNSIATVDSQGVVRFNQLGKVTITIQLKNNPLIKTEIMIEYTKNIKDISFTETNTQWYVGDTVKLVVQPYPIDAEGYTYTVSIDNKEIATLIKNNDEYALKGEKEGDVTVTIKVDGTDISYSRKFSFFVKLGDISLKLDNEEDVSGLGKYRVFGNMFISSTGKKTNSYIMEFSTVPSDKDYSYLVGWKSSNEKIATVDDNGKVTFHGTGVVTITVTQNPPFQGAKVVSDSYTFYVVDGINVYSYYDYLVATKLASTYNEELTDNFTAIVLHDNIKIEETLEKHEINYNIFGNGYMIDFTDDINYEKMIVKRSNIVIDNVILRGTSFSSNGALSELDGKGKILLITNHAKNVLVYNTIIENAFITAEVLSAQATFKGCIIRNSYSSGLILNRIENDSMAADVIIEDCIFARSLLSSISFSPDTSSELKGYESKLKIVGDLKLYNWLTLDEFKGESIIQFVNGLGFVVDDVINQVKDNIKKNYGDFKYTLNGKDYYLFGILDINAVIKGMRGFDSNGIIDRSEMDTRCNYDEAHLIGSCSYALTIDYDFTILTTLTKDKVPYIKPGDNYEGNQVILDGIRQPRRDKELGFLN